MEKSCINCNLKILRCPYPPEENIPLDKNGICKSFNPIALSKFITYDGWIMRLGILFGLTLLAFILLLNYYFGGK